MNKEQTKELVQKVQAMLAGGASDFFPIVSWLQRSMSPRPDEAHPSQGPSQAPWPTQAKDRDGVDGRLKDPSADTWWGDAEAQGHEVGLHSLGPIRFRHDPSLAFATRDVVDVALAPDPSLRTSWASPQSHPADEAVPSQAYAGPQGAAQGESSNAIAAQGDSGNAIAAQGIAVQGTAAQEDTGRESSMPLARIAVQTSFLGLSGAVSPLPSYMAEEVLHDDEAHGGIRDFLDIFHHRALSLFFHLMQRYQVEGKHQFNARDAWSLRLQSLAGIDAYPKLATNEGAMSLSSSARLRLLPVILSGDRSASALQCGVLRLLLPWLGEGASPQGESALDASACDARALPRAATFGVEIDSFIPHPVPIHAHQQTRLGRSSSVIGSSMVLGTRHHDTSAGFRVRIGPMPKHVYDACRKGGALHDDLHALVALFCAPGVGAELVLELDGHARGALAVRLAGTPLGKGHWLGGRVSQLQQSQFIDRGALTAGYRSRPQRPVDQAHQPPPATR